MQNIIDNTAVVRDWSGLLQHHPSMPSHLHSHQADAIALLTAGKHVLLGVYLKLKQVCTKVFSTAVPTGAGKSLPQLSAILLMDGNKNHKKCAYLLSLP